MPGDDAGCVHKPDHGHIADHVDGERDAGCRQRFVAETSDHDDDAGECGVAQESLEPCRRSEAEQFSDVFPVETFMAAGRVFLLVHEQEAGSGNAEGAEARDGAGESGAENSQRRQTEFAEDENIIQRNGDQTADDLDRRDDLRTSASGEERKKRRFHADQSRAGGKCDEVLRFVDSDARIVSVMRQYPCSPGRQGIGKQRRDDCPEIESVPCRADTPLAVVRTVMLRHNRRSKGRCDQEERHQCEKHL